MDILVGHTGFVGSNLCVQHQFDETYNSKNIQKAFGLNPDLCVYAGVRAEKFLANKTPEADMILIKDAINNIKSINPKKLVLISTIDVYKEPNGCTESTIIDEEGLHPYGYNRYQLEKWCAENVKECHILRLPGLFGKSIKKNFIYDLIHVLPSALNEEKYNLFSAEDEKIQNHYLKQESGFYMLQEVSRQERKDLLETFRRLNFSALNFTDSRAVFQFYNLNYLWKHIEWVMKHNIHLINMAVEPVSASEIYYEIHNKNFVNEIVEKPSYYDFRTKYSSLFCSDKGYIFQKERVLAEVLDFVYSQKRHMQT